MTPACAAVAAAARHDALMAAAMPKFIAAEPTPIHDGLVAKFSRRPKRDSRGRFLPKEQS